MKYPLWFGNGNPNYEDENYIVCRNDYSFGVVNKQSGKVHACGSINNLDPNLSAILETKNIEKIYSTGTAFAALDDNGKVYAFGTSAGGGNINNLNSNLSTLLEWLINLNPNLSTLLEDKTIVNIYSTYGAFAALDDNGKVYTWGDQDTLVDQAGNIYTWLMGGTSVGSPSIPTLVGNLANKNIVNIYSTSGAFAALDVNGKVYAWGSYGFAAMDSDGNIYSTTRSIRGGYTSTLVGNLSTKNIVNIYSTSGAFAAVDNNGNVYAWGFASGGGTTPASITGKNIVNIYSTGTAFAAVDNNGNVYAWGDPLYGGNIPTGTAAILADKTIVNIYSTGTAFAALDDNGKVYAWGFASGGGLINYPTNQYNTQGKTPLSIILENKTIVNIVSTDNSFAALDSEGKVYAWGSYGFIFPAYSMISNLLSNKTIVNISSTKKAFAALDSEGKVYAWGDGLKGGTLPSTLSTKNFKAIISSNNSFLGIDINNAFYGWGAKFENNEQIELTPEFPISPIINASYIQIQYNQEYTVQDILTTISYINPQPFNINDGIVVFGINSSINLQYKNNDSVWTPLSNHDLSLTNGFTIPSSSSIKFDNNNGFVLIKGWNGNSSTNFTYIDATYVFGLPTSQNTSTLYQIQNRPTFNKTSISFQKTIISVSEILNAFGYTDLDSNPSKGLAIISYTGSIKVDDVDLTTTLSGQNALLLSESSTLEITVNTTVNVRGWNCVVGTPNQYFNVSLLPNSFTSQLASLNYSSVPTPPTPPTPPPTDPGEIIILNNQFLSSRFPWFLQF
jgi:alpha-tubulin suppressor-like RCC1 family protein